MKSSYFILLFFNLFYNSNVFSQNNNKSNTILTNSSGNQAAAVIPITDPIETIPTIADRVRFLYDASGNQIECTICINCTSNRPAIAKNEIGNELSNDFFELDNLKFYPNPVTEDLNIEFNETTKTVSKILIYSLSNQLLQTHSNLNDQPAVKIPFNSFTTGTYIVNLEYNNGEIVDLKILKK